LPTTANKKKSPGSVTGMSMQSADLAGKRLELLREVLPRLRRLAIIGNAGMGRVELD
jgi:putative ABC transport system substrate-binding protein